MTARESTSTATDGRLWLAAVLLLAALGPFGCASKVDYGAIHGKVTCKGVPVTEGQVVFFEPGINVYQAAKIRSDGTYSVKMSSGPGLLVGKYQVAGMPPVVEGPGSRAAGSTTPRDYPQIPTRYRTPKSCQLTLTVEEGSNPPFDIDMKP